jgi:hypothetical protein
MVYAVQNATRATAAVEVDKEVARLSLTFFPMKGHKATATVMYVDAAFEHASKFHGLTMDRLCTTQHLQWKPVRLH